MAKTATVKTTDTDISDDVQPGVFGRMFRFLREVISELKKVTTPTRNLLLWRSLLCRFHDFVHFGA